MSRILICTVLMALLIALGSGPAAPPSGGPVAAPVALRERAAPQPDDDPGTRPPGEFGWPLPGSPAVVRAFEAPTHQYGPGHRGVDLAGQTGTPVLAAGAGTVVFAGQVAGRGVVSIDHPSGLRTTYEPVSPNVATGDLVAKGQQIGTLLAGHPGCPALSCLHWGARRGMVYLDPLRLLGLARLRLLPWEGSSGQG
ncbi:MAG: M23 family metallopeptidase [Pseudonocardiaceae bacterium]